jgi:pyroglutamyl-peptidase
MKLLLTGFEPFDDSPINPSEQVVLTLMEENIPGVQLETAILPVDLENGSAALLQVVEATQPDVVLCLGQASRRPVITIERVAINLLDFRIPDNAGNQVSDQPIVADGPAAYFTTLPVRAILNELKDNGIPVQLSLSAGAYLCNQIIYVLLHHLKSQGLDIPAGFIHLPNLPEQAALQDNPGPSMSLETMLQAIRIAIRVTTHESE